MSTKSGNTKAFSLVELVIVVAILGIIAAIAIPRISSSSRSASDSAVRANLQTLRNSIDWYYSEHRNTFPGVKTAGGELGAAGSSDAFINQLIYYTDAAGAVSLSKDALFPYGPYIRGDYPAVTVGANAGNATVTISADVGALTGDTTDGTGWKFSTATGLIIINSADYESY